MLNSLKIQQNPYSIFLEHNRATEAITNLAKREQVNPMICIRGLFAAMLEIVDPHDQFFKTLYSESYDSGPAVIHILNSSSKDHSILYFHEPRFVERQGIYEDVLLIKTYINLVALYLYKTENPHSNLSDTVRVIDRMSQIIQDTTIYEPNRSVAKITIPNNKLMNLINHDAIRRAILKATNSNGAPGRYEFKMCCS